MFRFYSKNFDGDFNEVAQKLVSLSLDCIKWSLIFSGLGIISPFAERDIKELDSKTNDKENLRNLLRDVVPVSAVYLKGKPDFAATSENIINPGKYMWDPNSFNKTIKISSQAFAILSLCTAAKILYDTDDDIGLIMVRIAENIASFATTYLRNKEGYFINAEDKAKGLNSPTNLKYTKSTPKIVDQIFMLEALLCLSQTTSGIDYKKYRSHSSEKNRDQGKNLFDFICESIDDLIGMSSRDISLAVSSLCRCITMIDDYNLANNYRNIIINLCAELETRTKATGELDKTFGSLTAASYITHFRAASSLIEGSLETGILKFNDVSNKIHYHIDKFYDPTLGNYIFQDNKKIKFTMRDLCEILKYQILKSQMASNSECVYRGVRIYNDWIENSGIVSCITSSNKEILDGTEYDFKKAPFMETSMKAPVFLRGIRINLTKSSILNPSKSFNSYYSLYSSYIFLNYLYPILNKKNEELDHCHSFIENESIKEADNMDRVSMELEVKIDETTEITEPEETLIRTPLENGKDSNDIEVIL